MFQNRIELLNAEPTIGAAPTAILRAVPAPLEKQDYLSVLLQAKAAIQDRVARFIAVQRQRRSAAAFAALFSAASRRRFVTNGGEPREVVTWHPSSPGGAKRDILDLRPVPQLPAATLTIRPVPFSCPKLFGRPYWLQDAEPHRCSCGAPMELIVQIPDGQGFPMAVGADEQPNSFSRTEYCIFLGNQLYVLGCTKQCDPKALWPILQH